MNPFTLKAMAVVGTVCAAVLMLTVPSQHPMNLFTSTGRDPALQKELEHEFVKFLATHGKSYASKSEIPTRFEKFAQNYMMVKEHNARGDQVSFKMAVNHLADMHASELSQISGVKFDENTILEFKSGYQLNQNKTESSNDTEDTNSTQIPPIDWRNYGRVSPVLN